MFTSRLATFVFVGNMGAVASAEAIDSACEAERRRREFEVDQFGVVEGAEAGMEFTAGEDAIMRDTDSLDLLKVKKPIAIRQRVEGFNTQRWRKCVD